MPDPYPDPPISWDFEITVNKPEILTTPILRLSGSVSATYKDPREGEPIIEANITDIGATIIPENIEGFPIPVDFTPGRLVEDWNCEGQILTAGSSQLPTNVKYVLTFKAETQRRGESETKTEIDTIPVDLKQPGQYAGWNRLEPRCRSDNFSRGIQARTADPLWLLTRQWQTGEFQGEDAGSPFRVELTYRVKTLPFMKLGEEEPLLSLAQPEGSLPIEMVAERESPGINWRTRVQMGQMFERMAKNSLGAEALMLIRDCREQYPVTLPGDEELIDIDEATRNFLSVIDGRAIDGYELLQAIKAEAFEPPSNVSKEEVQQIGNSLDKWHSQICSRPEEPNPAAWRNEQLEYRFTLFSDTPHIPPEDPRQNILAAPDYRNGDLDWYSFDVKRGLNIGSSQLVPTQSFVYPARLRIAGMSLRWWAFEDAMISFSGFDVAKPDLIRLILAEFMLVYGDDWYSIPLTLNLRDPMATDGTPEAQPLPMLVEIQRIKIYNVFDKSPSIAETARVENAQRLRRWEMFVLARDVGDIDRHGAGDALLLLPGAGYREESPPLEEIRFLRDEGANMVWGVENTVLNGVGRPVSGFDAQRERKERQQLAEIKHLLEQVDWLRETLASSMLPEGERTRLEAKLVEKQALLAKLESESRPRSDAVPRYRLATTVPDNWIPFVPANVSPNISEPIIRLRHAQMLRNVDDEYPEAIPPLTRLLGLDNGAPLLWLEEATVPRSGLRYQLTAQRMRWIDGKTYVWIGRKVVSGRGEGSSGLKFDVLSEK